MWNLISLSIYLWKLIVYILFLVKQYSPVMVKRFGERSYYKEEDRYDKVNKLQQSKRKVSHGKIGLWNLGNTCYMNSAVQALHTCQRFRERLLRSKPKESQVILKELKNTFHHLSYETESFPPRKLYKVARPSWFPPYSQQDSSEFLRYVLQALDDEHESLKDKSMLPTSIPDICFGGQLRHCFKCLKCDDIASAEEKFYDIPLNFDPHVTEVSLDELVDSFLKEEKMEGMIQCENCGTQEECEKQTQILKYPEYLVFNLMRFQSYKNMCTVHYPCEIEVPMSATCPRLDSLHYELISVIVHSGYTASSGHYFSYGKDTKFDTWYVFNDSYVKPIAFTHFAKSRTYGFKTETSQVLIYQRIPFKTSHNLDDCVIDIDDDDWPHRNANNILEELDDPGIRPNGNCMNHSDEKDTQNIENSVVNYDIQVARTINNSVMDLSVDVTKAINDVAQDIEDTVINNVNELIDTKIQTTETFVGELDDKLAWPIENSIIDLDDEVAQTQTTQNFVDEFSDTTNTQTTPNFDINSHDKIKQSTENCIVDLDHKVAESTENFVDELDDDSAQAIRNYDNNLHDEITQITENCIVDLDEEEQTCETMITVSETLITDNQIQNDATMRKSIILEGSKSISQNSTKTCHVNAAFQMLFTCHKFRRNILHDTSLSHIKLAREIKAAFTSILNMKGKSPLTPYDLEAAGLSVEYTNSTEYEDSSDFIRRVLKRLCKVENQTDLVRLFGGECSQEYKCKNCKSKEVCISQFHELCLNTVVNGTNSNIVQLEDLLGRMGVTHLCTKCNTQEIVQEMKIKEFPEYLLLSHSKKVQSNDRSMRLIYTPVMRLSSSNGRITRNSSIADYDLISVIHRSRNSTGCYTCFARCSCKKCVQKSEWYCFGNNEVVKTQFDEIAWEIPSVLMYRKTETTGLDGNLDCDLDCLIKKSGKFDKHGCSIDHMEKEGSITREQRKENILSDNRRTDVMKRKVENISPQETHSSNNYEATASSLTSPDHYSRKSSTIVETIGQQQSNKRRKIDDQPTKVTPLKRSKIKYKNSKPIKEMNFPWHKKH